MYSAKNPTIFSKEFKTDDFTISIHFSENGNLRGVFILEQDSIPMIWELSNGLFLRIPNNLYFTFSVNWSHSSGIHSSTYFSGFTQLLSDGHELTKLEWLLTYENLLLEECYSASDSFILLDGYGNITKLPYRLTIHQTSFLN